MDYVNIGKITSTHGLKGELKLKSNFLYINRVLVPNFTLFIGKEKEKTSLMKYRYHNGMYLITLIDYEDINLVEKFRNQDVYIIRDDLDLKENELLFEDYINLQAYYKEEKLGIIEDIIDCGNGNYVFNIKGNRQILIPVNKKFIKEVIIKDRVIFKEVEGLLDAN